MGNCFGSDEPPAGALLGATIDSSIPSTVEVGEYVVKVGKVRGKGGFSDVYAAEIRGKPGTYALKVMLVPTPERLDMAKNECKYLASLQSPFIVHLYASKIEGEKVFMLMDYYDRGTLADVISAHQKAGTRFDEKEALTLFRDICNGVKVLHSHSPPLVHRDLKPGNILLAADGKPVLMDFGSIGEAHVSFKSHKAASQLQDFCSEACSILYRAPELFNVSVDSTLDERVDVWSLGCTLYCMLFYTSPFEAAYYDGSVALAAMNAKVTIPATSPYSPEVHQLVLSMLQAEPSRRPFVDAVVETATRLITRTS